MNPEPYYNEAGYERQKGTQIGHENSRMYNEMAIVKMVQVAYGIFFLFSFDKCFIWTLGLLGEEEIDLAGGE